VQAPQVTPQTPVPTIRELQPQTPATAIVQVGGPNAQQQAQQPQQPVVMQSTTPNTNDQPPITIVGNEPTQRPTQVAQQQPAQPPVTPVDTQNRNVPQSNDLAQVAHQHGETLVTVTPDGQQRPLQSGQMVSQQPQQTAQVTGYREYTVQSGDSLSKIASRMMGSNTKANREAIVRANPSLAANPDIVVVGKTYKIPVVNGSQATGPAPTQTTQVVQAPSQLITPQAPRPAAPTEYWYTVREGDTLTRIAREQLGQDDSVVPAIVELNRETIANPDSLRVNMKIRLPAKPLAQAN
jgi:phage tail protein X